MFDIGWSEMAIIMLVALIVIGPKDLPRVARNVGRWVAKGRALARDFQNQLEDMAREAELDKVKSEIEKAGRTDLKRSVERSIDPKGELKNAFDPDAKPKAAQQEAVARSGAAGEGARSEPETARAEPATPAPEARTNGAANGRAAPEPAPEAPRKEQAPTH